MSSTLRCEFLFAEPLRFSRELARRIKGDAEWGSYALNVLKLLGSDFLFSERFLALSRAPNTDIFEVYCWNESKLGLFKGPEILMFASQL